jgi:carnosine N-methyltransferase
LLKKRAAMVRQARDANRQFVDKVIEDLPDLCSGPDALTPPPQPVAEFRTLSEDCPTLPATSYGSLASVFLHLLRDWSTDCAHVGTSTYDPAVAELRALLPQGGNVLVPGAGLGRLALALAAKGYSVEANDASRLFLTFADYVLNRAPAESHTLFPMAHVFSENWSHEAGQYMKIQVPMQGPALQQPITFVAGDFAKTYGPGRPGQRRFDAIVTCFFIDTAVDVLEQFKVMDGLLAEGGIWVNIGPLNWRKEARLKLSWDEVVNIWERLGYEFVTKKSAEVDYHLPRGLKMYTESYNCALTAAIKRGRPKDA